MPHSVKTKLFRAAARTFEELGFLFPTSQLDDYQRATSPVAAVSVEFTGPFCGRLVVTACGGLLPTLAANMLGEDHPPSEQQKDALKEMANVICGNVLPRIASKEAVFYLAAPNLINPSEARKMSPQESVAAEVEVGLDGGRAEILLITTVH